MGSVRMPYGCREFRVPYGCREFIVQFRTGPVSYLLNVLSYILFAKSLSAGAVTATPCWPLSLPPASASILRARTPAATGTTCWELLCCDAAVRGDGSGGRGAKIIEGHAVSPACPLLLQPCTCMHSKCHWRVAHRGEGPIMQGGPREERCRACLQVWLSCYHALCRAWAGACKRPEQLLQVPWNQLATGGGWGGSAAGASWLGQTFAQRSKMCSDV